MPMGGRGGFNGAQGHFNPAFMQNGMQGGGGGGGGSSEGLFSPGASGSGGLKPPGGAFGFAGAHGPSPLATSPPVMPMDEDDDEEVPAGERRGYMYSEGACS